MSTDRIAPLDRIAEIERLSAVEPDGDKYYEGFLWQKRFCDELISIARTAIAERDAIFTAGPSLLKGLEGVPSYPADIRKHADELRGNAYYRVREFLKQTGRGEFQPGYLPSVIEYLSEYAAARIRGEREAAYRKGVEDAAAYCDELGLTEIAEKIRALAAPLTKG